MIEVEKWGDVPGGNGNSHERFHTRHGLRCSCNSLQPTVSNLVPLETAIRLNSPTVTETQNSPQRPQMAMAAKVVADRSGPRLSNSTTIQSVVRVQVVVEARRLARKARLGRKRQGIARVYNGELNQSKNNPHERLQTWHSPYCSCYRLSPAVSNHVFSKTAKMRNYAINGIDYETHSSGLR